MLKVFSVPMRNWNELLCSLSGPHQRTFSAYLWGIETFVSSCRTLSSLEFSAYLWGIETTTRKYGRTFTCSVFSVPMRNWNFHPWAQQGTPPARFQRTYEELKLQQIFQHHAAGTSFQRTYEELKLPLLHNIFFHFLSFQRTYEELKPASLGVAARRAIRFQRTYEELKPPSEAAKRAARICFQRTYEELKRAIRTPDQHHQGVFSVPMRNWNQWWARLMTERPLRFQRTYEELKL